MLMNEGINIPLERAIVIYNFAHSNAMYCENITFLPLFIYEMIIAQTGSQCT